MIYPKFSEDHKPEMGLIGLKLRVLQDRSNPSRHSRKNSLPFLFHFSVAICLEQRELLDQDRGWVGEGEWVSKTPPSFWKSNTHTPSSAFRGLWVEIYCSQLFLFVICNQ